MNSRSFQLRVISAITLIVALSQFANAQTTTGMNTGETVADAAVPENDAMAPIRDEPGLPRVLLIGDSISISYTLAVRKLLQGKANVHRVRVNCQDTSTGKAGTNVKGTWLGEARWDVIHFNFGIWDAKIVPATGQPAHAQQEYVENLQTIAERLKQKSSAVIFATTTPIPKILLTTPSGQPVPATTRLFVDVKPRNDDAVASLEPMGVRINDLYAVINPDREKHWRKGDLHFKPEGSIILAEAVAASIEKALADVKTHSHASP